ncbi:MAG: c-type cytochrome, partial [Massilia sp.]
MQGLVSRAGAAAPQASLQAGQKLAASGAPNGIAACSGCHGANGEGNAAANFPALAGQPAAYLERQLRGFAGGARNNPVMTPIAKAMSADQQRDASAWYASIAPSAQAPTGGAAGGAGGAGGAAPGQGATAKGAGTNAALLKRGSELAARG